MDEKIVKLRQKLVKGQKQREEFEAKKKLLEEQMQMGRKNIEKITKGLKNNVILNDPEFILDLETIQTSPNATIKKINKKSLIGPQGMITPTPAGQSYLSMNAALAANMNSPDNNPNGPASGNNNANSLQQHVIIPSGPRISDWCFTGALDSTPPTVKSRELYENIRLLGRGSFGEVNLAKNIEDNKLYVF